MLSPFEELEYLSDYLPEEGEAVIVSRQSGELLCEPYLPPGLREGITDPQMYGMLVHANERLNTLGSMPIWMTTLGFFWTCVGLAYTRILTWSTWFLVPGLVLIMLPGCIAWIRYRQEALFRRELWPMLCGVMRFRHLDPHALLGAIRQHRELRTLLDELVRRTMPVTDKAADSATGP